MILRDPSSPRKTEHVLVMMDPVTPLMDTKSMRRSIEILSFVRAIAHTFGCSMLDNKGR